MSEHAGSLDPLGRVPGGEEVYELFGTIEGEPERMQGSIEAMSPVLEPASFTRNLFVQSTIETDILYAQLDTHCHVWMAKVIRYGTSTLTEYDSRDPGLSGKVALAKVQRTADITRLLGSFHLVDTEHDYSYEYSLLARIHDLAPRVRWLEGTLSRLRKL